MVRRPPPASGGSGGHLAGWFADDAASSATVDLPVVKGRHLHLRVTRPAVALTPPAALASTSPPFLALRHRRPRGSGVGRATVTPAGGTA